MQQRIKQFRVVVDAEGGRMDSKWPGQLDASLDVGPEFVTGRQIGMVIQNVAYLVAHWLQK